MPALSPDPLPRAARAATSASAARPPLVARMAKKVQAVGRSLAGTTTRNPPAPSAAGGLVDRAATPSGAARGRSDPRPQSPAASPAPSKSEEDPAQAPGEVAAPANPETKRTASVSPLRDNSGLGSNSTDVESRERSIKLHGQAKARAQRRSMNIYSQPIDLSAPFSPPHFPKSAAADAVRMHHCLENQCPCN